MILIVCVQLLIDVLQLDRQSGDRATILNRIRLALCQYQLSSPALFRNNELWRCNFDPLRGLP